MEGCHISASTLNDPHFMPNKHFYNAFFLSRLLTHVHKMHLHTNIITNNIFILHQFLGNFPCQFTVQTRPSWVNYCYPSPDTGVHCRWGTLARNFFGDNFVREFCRSDFTRSTHYNVTVWTLQFVISFMVERTTEHGTTSSVFVL